jgi:hypothetical protein
MYFCFRKKASLKAILRLFQVYFNFFNFGFTTLDHPIHPPPHVLSSHNDGEIPESANCVIKALNGVFQVYESQEAADNGESLNFSYPVFKKYIDDVHKMCNMISNGPL